MSVLEWFFVYIIAKFGTVIRVVLFWLVVYAAVMVMLADTWVGKTFNNAIGGLPSIEESMKPSPITSVVLTQDVAVSYVQYQGSYYDIVIRNDNSHPITNVSIQCLANNSNLSGTRDTTISINVKNVIQPNETIRVMENNSFPMDNDLQGYYSKGCRIIDFSSL